MVLTKFVNVKINNHSMPHYRALGYDVKMFDTITVPIGHLTPKSTVKIRVKCDYCGAEYEITYSSYTKNVELDERLGKARTDGHEKSPSAQGRQAENNLKFTILSLLSDRKRAILKLRNYTQRRYAL